MACSGSNLDDVKTLIDLDALTALFPNQVATMGELTTLGLGGATLRARLARSGGWQRLFPGVVLLADGPPTRRQTVQAALRYAGPGAVVTGRDAVQLHGAQVGGVTPDDPVRVLVTAERAVRSCTGLVTTRGGPGLHPVLRNGFLVAPLPRAAIDTVRVLGSLDQARALLGGLVRHGRVTVEALRAELTTGVRGGALARTVVAELAAGARSPAESWAREIAASCGLPRPRWNVPVRRSDGPFLSVVDAWWDEVALAWEIDCGARTPPPRALTAAGIAVVRSSPTKLRREPNGVIADLRDAYKNAARRDRPKVVAA